MALVMIVAPRFSVAGDQAESQIPIRIGYQPGANWLLIVARKQKLFEKAGLSPTYVECASGPAMIAAAHDAAINVSDLGPVPFMIGQSEGIDWAVIGIATENAYTSGVAVLRESGIVYLSDLRGRRIGFVRGTNSHYGLIMALRQYGVRADQVTLVEVSWAQMPAALANKEIDAAMVVGLSMLRVVHEMNGKIIATEGDLGIYTNVGLYAARREWLAGQKEAAVRFLRALLMASDLVQTDPDSAISTVAGQMGVKRAWVKQLYKDAPPPNMYLWTDRKYRYSLVRGAAFQRRLDYLKMFLSDEQIIPSDVDVSEMLDPSVISAALRTWKESQ